MLDYVRIINFCIIIFINIHNAWDQTSAFCMYPLNSLFFLGSCAVRHWKMTFLLSIYSDERYIQSYQTALAPRISTLGIFWAIISRKWHYHSAIHPVSSFDALRHSFLLKLVNRLTCISIGLNFEATETTDTEWSSACLHFQVQRDWFGQVSINWAHCISRWRRLHTDICRRPFVWRCRPAVV